MYIITVSGTNGYRDYAVCETEAGKEAMLAAFEDTGYEMCDKFEIRIYDVPIKVEPAVLKYG